MLSWLCLPSQGISLAVGGEQQNPLPLVTHGPSLPETAAARQGQGLGLGAVGRVSLVLLELSSGTDPVC